MSDSRYSNLFKLPSGLYAVNSPIIVKAGALLKDNEARRLLAQLKLHSIADKDIKLCKVEITCFDAMGRQLDQPIVHSYLDLFVKRDVDFGTRTPVLLPNMATRSFSVRVLEVGFKDNTLWSDNEAVWENMPQQKPINSNTHNAFSIKAYQAKYGIRAYYEMCDHKDLWICTCGAINHKDEVHCHDCQASHNELSNLDWEECRKSGIYITAMSFYKQQDENSLNQAKALFEQIKDYNDVNDLITSCDKQIADIEAHKEQMRLLAEEKKKKTKKKVKITLFIIGAVILAIAIALGLIFYVIPQSRYDKALRLIESGNYDEAYTILADLGDYSDASQQIFAGKYKQALELINKGEYDKGIKIFENLKGYADSATQIKVGKYKKATDLLNKKQYDAAYAIFQSLGNYSDSAEQISKSKYERAMVYYNAKNYDEAIKLFQEIKTYKDSTQKLKDCVKIVAEEYLSKKDYTGFVKYTQNKEIPDVTIPKAEYSTFYKFIMDYYGLYEKNYYASNIANFLEEPSRYLRLISNYGPASDVIAFYEVFDNYSSYSTSGTLIKTYRSKLSNTFDTTFCRNILLSDNLISYFLIGNWYSEEFVIYDEFWGEYYSEVYYFKIYESGSSLKSSYNIPYPDEYHSYWDIIDCEFVFTDSRSEIVAYVYSIEFVNANTIRVYSYEEGVTYTLTRE